MLQADYLRQQDQHHHALRHVSDAISRTFGKNLEAVIEVVPHIRALAQYVVAVPNPSLHGLTREYAPLFEFLGDYETALALYEWALKTMPDIPAERADILYKLGTLYDELDHDDEARHAYNEAYQLHLQWTAKDSLYVAQDLIALAKYDQFDGDFAQAEQRLKQALAIRSERLSGFDPRVADAYDALFNFYTATDQIAKRATLEQQRNMAWQRTIERATGDDLPILEQLAYDLARRADYYEAIPIRQRIFELTERRYGKNHVYTATSLSNLAVLLDNTGHYEEAEPLFRRAIAICEQQLGHHHPDTASSLSNLAGLLHHTGRYEEAEPLFRRALAIREQQLGHHHPDTASSLNNLASVLHSTGRYEEAEPLYRRALAIREQHLGHHHPDTATSLGNLAVLLDNTGRYEEAEPLYRQALTILLKTLGEQHPHTKIFWQSYSICLKAMLDSDDPALVAQAQRACEELGISLDEE